MEKISILGKSTRKALDLNRWLATKKCPQYGDLYVAAGEEFNVRGDMALFQSCLETGWFWNNEGPFDVKPEQQNFAGLGATGNGVPGDSFPDAKTGIRAQCQDLALRCDTYLPKESIISPYAKKQYETISNRHSKLWEDLSGTWAADKTYHTQIYRIATQFDTWLAANSKPDSEAETITKIMLNRKDDGTPVATAYAGDVARWTRVFAGGSFDSFCEWCQQFVNISIIGVEDTTKAFPKLPDYGVEDPLPPEEKTEWLPFAKRAQKSMKTVEKRWPKYLIIHWTAGEPSQSGEDGIASGVGSGYTYLFLPRDGQIWQGAPTHAGGYHAGNALVSSLDCLGIEVANAGKVEKLNGLYVPWFAKNSDGSINKARCIPASDVIYDNDGTEDDGSFEGYYQKYTEAQVKGLTKLALYCVQVLGIDVTNIRGHDEIATPHGRKVDPGFSIGDGGMVAFRKKVSTLIQQGVRWDSL